MRLIVDIAEVRITRGNPSLTELSPLGEHLKLPNRGQTSIPRAKLVDYLLCLSHPHGRHKAAFFISLGFTDNAWHTLASALLKHADDHGVTAVERTPFGTRYTIEGRLAAPDGRTPLVRVVWFIESGQDTPRLVTAYPIGRGGS